MLASICQLAALDCEVVPLADLAHLVPAVANVSAGREQSWSDAAPACWQGMELSVEMLS